VAAKHQRCGAHAAFTEECFGSVTRKTKEKTAPPSFCRRACRIKETRRFCLELKVAAVRLGLIRPTYETSNWHLWHLKIFKRSIIANYVDRDLVRRWKIDWRSARIMTLSLSNDFQSWLGSLRPLLTSTHKAYVDRANTNGGKSNVQIKITASSWHDSVSQLEGDKVPEAHRGNFPKTLRLSRTNMFSGC
jgi:hypothetical protein